MVNKIVAGFWMLLSLSVVIMFLHEAIDCLVTEPWDRSISEILLFMPGTLMFFLVFLHFLKMWRKPKRIFKVPRNRGYDGSAEKRTMP